MLIKIGEFEFTVVWDGVLYKKPSHYPVVSDWEKRNIIEFVEYEASHGRQCQIECENADVLAEVNQALQNRETYRHAPRPALITVCTACPVRKGCVTEFVCHTTSPENARKILECGSLLSAIKARNLTVEELMAESRNAVKDPADYFEYIMLAWGNCQAGDRLVMERKLGKFPDEQDLSKDASEETLRRNKRNDSSCFRNFFVHHLQYFIPLKKAWFIGRPDVDVLDVDGLTPEKLGRKVKEWAERWCAASTDR